MNYGFISHEKLMKLPEKDRLSKMVLAHNKKSAEYQKNLRKSAGDPALMGEPKKEVFIMTGTPLMHWENLYRPIDMTVATNDTYEQLNIKGGIVFHQHVPGGEVEMSTLPEASETLLKMLRFSAGLPISNDWIRFNQYYKIEEVMDAALSGWTLKRYAMHWMLMNALPATQNIAFDTDVVTTINNACAETLNRLEAKSYANVDSFEFYIQCHRNNLDKFQKALAANYSLASNNNNKLLYPIKGVVPSSKVTVGTAFVSVPGLKNIMPEWELYNMRPPQGDEKKLGTDYIWTGAYNMAIGEIDQHMRIALN